MRVVLASKSPARLKTLQSAGIHPIVMVSHTDESAVLAALPGGRFGQGGSTTPADEVSALASAKCRAVCESLMTAPIREAACHRTISHDGETPLNSSPAISPQRTGQTENPHNNSALVTNETQLVVIGCDSMLEINGRMAGKPHTPEVARQRIQEMRNSEATLWTGHAVALLERSDVTHHWSLVKQIERSAHTLVRFGNICDAEIEAYIATGEPLEVAGSFTVDALGGPFVSSIEGDFHSVVGLSLPLMRDMIIELGIFWPDLWTPLS